MNFPDLSRHSSPCCGYDVYCFGRVAPNVKLTISSFPWEDFTAMTLTWLWVISWHFCDSCQIPRHFPVCQTSGNPKKYITSCYDSCLTRIITGIPRTGRPHKILPGTTTTVLYTSVSRAAIIMLDSTCRVEVLPIIRTCHGPSRESQKCDWSYDSNIPVVTPWVVSSDTRSDTVASYCNNDLQNFIPCKFYRIKPDRRFRLIKTWSSSLSAAAAAAAAAALDHQTAQ